jgi:[acyl-carrier-protein] S-malonyltransferase
VESELPVLTAFLCPGQGSQTPGMGADLVEAFPTARALYDEADSILDWSVSELCFGEPSDQLNDTRYTQPALYVHSVAAGTVLKEAGIQPDYAAGHSLGEYSALALAGAFTFADGLRLVVRRANAMADAGKENPGTMAAIIGLDAQVVADALADIDGAVPANLNAPDQIVISGTVEGVGAGCERLSEMGAKRVVPLTVSGAFHSPLVAPAADSLREALAETDIRTADIPVIANVTAEPVTQPDNIRELLARQITSPVRWTEVVRALVAAGVTTGYEVGPGKVLQGLARRIDRAVKVQSAGTADDLNSLRES